MRGGSLKAEAIAQNDLGRGGEHATQNRAVHRLNNILSKFQGVAEKDIDDPTESAMMLALVAKYRHFAEVPAVGDINPLMLEGHVVVLTGATGALGAHLLDRFLALPYVSRVYCLCRAKGISHARERVNESLIKRGLAPLDTRVNASRVICWPATFGDPLLGLTKQQYTEIQQSVSVIVNNAWPVSFKMPLEKFEADHIRGVHNLLNLAITARNGHPASSFFASSAGAVAGSLGPKVAEEISMDPARSFILGYTKSKWVAEQLFYLAGLTRGVRAEVLRLGQIMGDTIHGIWNEAEAIPLMIKTSQTLGIVPDLRDTVAWVPMDQAAQVCTELIFAPVELVPRRVWHIINPDRTATWTSLYQSLQNAGFQFRIIPRNEWLHRLRTLDPAERARNPAVKVMPYYEGQYGNPEQGPWERLEYSTEITVRWSPTLSKMARIDEALIRKFVQKWTETGFLQRPVS